MAGLVQTMRMDSWMALMESTQLLSLDFTPPQAQTCYMWARMSTVDELKVGAGSGPARNPVVNLSPPQPFRSSAGSAACAGCAGLRKA